MRRIRTAAVLALMGGLVGCAASPKYVAASTGSPGQIKFLYFKAGGDQGVIKCARAEDGGLSDCRTMTIELKGE